MALARIHIGPAGFTVAEYYHRKPTGSGCVAPGWVRLGAERPLVLFTAEEEAQVEQDFTIVMDQATFPYQRVGTDDWVAGTELPEPPSDAGTAPVIFK